MAESFDVTVIGVGMAGLNVARRLQSARQAVAVADSRPYPMPDNLEQMLKKIGVATYYSEVQFMDTNILKLGN